mmetsp:Transcript_53460/g.168276  ORF Transcript_53460/g.168276 Transcript_53460/m.168276 type:complete len:340 (-) Transcript_53460:29-1048(-)
MPRRRAPQSVPPRRRPPRAPEAWAAPVPPAQPAAPAAEPSPQEAASATVDALVLELSEERERGRRHCAASESQISLAVEQLCRERRQRDELVEELEAERRRCAEAREAHEMAAAKTGAAGGGRVIEEDDLEAAERAVRDALVQRLEAQVECLSRELDSLQFDDAQRLRRFEGLAQELESARDEDARRRALHAAWQAAPPPSTQVVLVRCGAAVKLPSDRPSTVASWREGAGPRGQQQASEAARRLAEAGAHLRHAAEVAAQVRVGFQGPPDAPRLGLLGDGTSLTTATATATGRPRPPAVPCGEAAARASSRTSHMGPLSRARALVAAMDGGPGPGSRR